MLSVDDDELFVTFPKALYEQHSASWLMKQ